MPAPLGKIGDDDTRLVHADGAKRRISDHGDLVELLAGRQIDDRDRMAALVTTIEPLGFLGQGQRDRPGANGDSTDHGPLVGVDQGDRVRFPLGDVKDLTVG
ncbi:MAG: hypothetical protein L0Z50_25820 [Verrucomicrobiales bacterium]|nr:hypothetical protein [Verrucomicrobiales bacterium]